MEATYLNNGGLRSIGLHSLVDCVLLYIFILQPNEIKSANKLWTC
jgi:hypothetical protein